MQQLLIGVVAGAIAAYAATLHGQLAPVPSPAPGITTVTGSVAVANEPRVLARQDENWVVTCSPPSRSEPAIVQPGERVTLTYPDGRTESVQVTSVRSDGWIVAGPRRINLATVVAIQP